MKQLALKKLKSLVFSMCQLPLCKYSAMANIKHLFKLEKHAHSGLL